MKKTIAAIIVIMLIVVFLSTNVVEEKECLICYTKFKLGESGIEMFLAAGLLDDSDAKCILDKEKNEIVFSYSGKEITFNNQNLEKVELSKENIFVMKSEKKCSEINHIQQGTQSMTMPGGLTKVEPINNMVEGYKIIWERH